VAPAVRHKVGSPTVCGATGLAFSAELVAQVVFVILDTAGNPEL